MTAASGRSSRRPDPKRRCGPSDLSSLDVADGDYVLVSGYNVMYPDSAPMVLEWIAQLSDDVVVAFDPAIRVMDIPEENLRRVLERADWTLCNETEASSLTGEDVVGRRRAALAARTGRRGVVVRHGASGCTVLVKDGEPVHVAGFRSSSSTPTARATRTPASFSPNSRWVPAVIEAAQRGNAAAAVAISVLGPASCPDARRRHVDDQSFGLVVRETRSSVSVVEGEP